MTRSSNTVAAPTRPADGFNGLGLHDELARAVADLGFTTPTSVQADAIPPALDGRDVLAAASTGSGKTAAFLLPVLQRVLRKPRGTTRTLVLTPTRELAAQVAEHFQELARHTKVRCAAVYGGVGMTPQERAFRNGVDVIVATPGRLLDHMQYDYARMAGLEVLILDEADRMLDMGFLPDIRRILRGLPRTPRQTLFFSATMPAPIVSLSKEMLHDPAMIDIKRTAAPATGITQAFYPVPAGRKVALLVDLLEQGVIGNAIVFTRTKHRANRVADRLDKLGVSAAKIHGNRSQNQRTEALAGFKDGRFRVLVATDIVARGIDVEALDHVVNFDVPAAAEDYIHRVGRTARAGMTGDAFTLVSPEEEDDVQAIERALGRRVERRRLDGFDYAERGEALEVPLAERIAAIRARKKEERARAAANAERKARAQAGGARDQGGKAAGGSAGRRRRR